MELKQKQVIMIWILGNPECLRTVADRFNITKSILFRFCFSCCCSLLPSLLLLFGFFVCLFVCFVLFFVFNSKTILKFHSSFYVSWNDSRDRIVVSTLRCGRNNPGSNPGHGTHKTVSFFLHLLFLPLILFLPQ